MNHAPSPASMHTSSSWRPLTQAQEGLWYAQSLDPQNPIFNTGHCTDIRSPLNLALFIRAINLTLQEADSLSLRTRQSAQGPEQQLQAHACPQVEVMTLSDQADALAQAQQIMQDDLHRPTHTDTQALSRQILFILADDHVQWYQRVHHLAADGYGMALIESRVVRLYHALLENRDLGTPLASFDLVLAEDAHYRQSEQAQQDRQFWRHHLAQAEPALSLTEQTALSAHHFLLDRRTASAQLVQVLQAKVHETQISWPDILTALCSAYVKRHTRQNPCTVGVPYMGRLGSASARAVATVMNVMPVVIHVDEQLPLNDYLIAVSKLLRQARRHGRYRSEQLRRDLGLLGGLQRLHGPIINMLPFDAAYEQAGLQASQTVLCAGPVEDINFTFRAAADGAGMRIELEANPKLYTQEALHTHQVRLHDFLLQALHSESLVKVPTLTQAEHQHWIYSINQTQHPVPDVTLWQLIAPQLQARAQAPALEFEGQLLSYAQLDECSQRVAAQLQDQGVIKGDIVAVALPRSVELIVSILAICRLGAAYLPLDIQQPHDRLAAILASAQARAIIQTGQESFALPTVQVDLRYPRRYCDDCPATPQDPAYLLYTSGSTGTPKGVLINHSAIVNRLLWMQTHYQINTHDRILQKTPATFDVSVWEFFLAFIAGGCLVVAPPDAHRDPRHIAHLIRERHISVLHFVPSMLAAFLDEPSAQDLQTRLVFCSGEELPTALRDRFHRTVQAELHNLYGPTEAAVDVSYWPASAQDTSQPIPIGYPVWNTALYVLDEYLRPVPPGVNGDLYLAGRQLAQGYWGQEALTQERFVPDPYPVHGTRMYATGDIARWRPDGALLFLGRSDHQVKLRGQRIELGEIEAVLATHPAVAQLAVIARQDQANQQAIVAYVVAHPGQATDSQTLLDFAAQKLPDYMLPAAVMWLEQLPVTPNGKLDRKALPAPFIRTRQRGAALQGALQQTIAAAFNEVLSRDGSPVYADDDFFALGGHSLLAARLALLLRQRLALDVSIGTIFEYPSVRRLAQHLHTRSTQTGTAHEDGFGPILHLRPADEPSLPALFTIHPAGGLGWCYGQLARELPQGRAIYGLQARSLDGQTRHLNQSLHAMASDYVDQIQALQAHGPYHLAGWSVGGIIAHAMAVELQARGEPVGLLAMLDAYPSDAWRDQPEPAEDAVYKALLHIAGHDPDTLPHVALTRTGVIDFLRSQSHPLAALADDRLNAIFQVVAQNNALVRRHQHAHYAGKALYIQAALDHQGTHLHPSMWRPYIQAIDVHPIDSLHAHLTGPLATQTIAPLMQAHMLAAEATLLTTGE